MSMLYVQRKWLLAMHLFGILWICYHQQLLSQNHTKIKCKQLHNVNRLCIFTRALMQSFVSYASCEIKFGKIFFSILYFHFSLLHI
jgi:hypothetical protein